MASPAGEYPGWRIEGHHISINFTVADGQVVSTTPLFLGANPAQVRHGELEGLQVLEAEEKLARKLMSQFNEEQKKQVIFSDEAPSDILTGARVRVSPLEQQGLPVSEMTGEQKQTLHALLEEYVYRVRPEFAEEYQKAKELGWKYLNSLGGRHKEGKDTITDSGTDISASMTTRRTMPIMCIRSGVILMVTGERIMNTGNIIGEWKIKTKNQT